jgi:30S ribosomal protein S31
MAMITSYDEPAAGEAAECGGRGAESSACRRAAYSTVGGELTGRLYFPQLPAGDLNMGKGDRRTRRGKIYNGSYGKKRPGRAPRPANGAAPARPKPGAR